MYAKDKIVVAHFDFYERTKAKKKLKQNKK